MSGARTAGLVRTVALGGLPLRLEADDATRAGAVEALFGACPAATGPAVGEVRFAGPAPDLPPGPPDLRFREVEVWLTAGVAARHASGVVAVRRGSGIDVGGPRDLPDPARAYRRALQHVLADLLADHGRWACHAAALARDDVAVLAVGDTGAGKSTLAWAALRAGWDVLTDDIAWITVSQGLHAEGFPKRLNVPADALVAPPEGSHPLPADARRRWVLPSTSVRPAGRVPLVGVLTLGHSDGDGRLVPAPGGPDRLGALLRSHPLAVDPRRLKAFFPVAGALGRLPALTLLHDARGDRRADVAAGLLDEALARFRHAASAQ